MKHVPHAKSHRRKLHARKLAEKAAAEHDATRRKQITRRARLMAKMAEGVNCHR